MPGLPYPCRYLRLSFNEAGADCPGMQEFAQEYFDENDASMRPGQTAPECFGISDPLCLKFSSFNEAGADCPGMLSRTAH